ncbi:tetratricopeptide repeat protein [Acrasis kona]|uniref:Tetratricopeptide repeat protein n=1 Tax=Acrasis kona TaxID=1008807 RepID=A0AAW2ZC86_9EUKA
MFRQAEHATWLTCNNRVDEAILLVKPHKKKNPLCAAQEIHSHIQKIIILSVGSDAAQVENILNLVTEAEQLVANIEASDENVLEFAKNNNKLNLIAESEPPMGYIPPPFEPESVQKVANLSNSELIKQYRAVNHLISAELYVIRGAMQFFVASYVKAVYNIRVGVKAFEALYEQTKTQNLHADIVDCIKIGYGLFQYNLSLVPPALQWLLSMLGFGGDRELGLKLANESVSSQGRLGYVACFGLGAHYLLIGGGLKPRFNKVKKYETLLSQYMPRYPQSSAFLSFHAQVQRKKGDISGAISDMEIALKSASEKLDCVPKFIASELAQCYFLNKDYEQASLLLEKVLLNGETAEFPGRSLSALVLAMIYSCDNKIKQRDELLSSLEKYYNLTKKNMPLERFVTAKNETLKKISDPEERTVCLITSYLELLYARDRLNDMNHEAEKYFSPLLDLLNRCEVTNSDVQLSKMFFEAVFERRLGKVAASDYKDKLFDVLDASENTTQNQWAALANFELAEIQWSQPEKNVAAIEKYLKACESVKGYASEDILHSRIKAAHRQTKTEKKRQHLK